MKIYALQTGTVQIKDTQQQGKGANQIFNVLFGGTWIQPQPILAWLIEHPDGLILVDTGETSRTNNKGYLPQHRPDWFNPVLLDFPQSGQELFDGSHELASAVHIVATPGHSTGHISVLVQDSDVHYLLAGDTSYTQDLMLSLTADGVSPDANVAKQTLQAIQQYVQKYPTVYLPSHDLDSIQRLNPQHVAS